MITPSRPCRERSQTVIALTSSDDDGALKEDLGRVEAVEIAARFRAGKYPAVAGVSGLEETDPLNFRAGRPDLASEEALVDEPHARAHRDLEPEGI